MLSRFFVPTLISVHDYWKTITLTILLEKELADHSSILTWKIPWTEEAGRLQSMGSQTVEHD